jgi:hypothetical protein
LPQQVHNLNVSVNPYIGGSYMDLYSLECYCP